MTLGPEPTNAHQNPVTAIDIALEPDQTMVGHAKAANAALLRNFPKGFALDATHHPHVSIFAGFVPTADLPKVYDVAGKVLAKENYTAWKLPPSNTTTSRWDNLAWVASWSNQPLTCFACSRS